MKISVKVKPHAKEERVTKVDEKNFIVAIKARPVEGQANVAAIKAIARYFDVPRSRVRIISGHTSHHKLIDIDQ